MVIESVVIAVVVVVGGIRTRGFCFSQIVVVVVRGIRTRGSCMPLCFLVAGAIAVQLAVAPVPTSCCALHFCSTIAYLPRVMADESGQHFDRALDFMKILGISRAKVAPLLRRLIQLYDNNWDMIEDENYRVLADSYFDELENEEAQLYSRVTRSSARQAAHSNASTSRSCEWRADAEVRVSRGIDVRTNGEHASSSSTIPPNKDYEWNGSVGSLAMGVDNTIRKSQATLPSAPSNSCYRCLNFDGDEDNLVQSETGPLKQLKEESPSGNISDSCIDNQNLQLGFSALEAKSPNKCLQIRWEEAANEWPTYKENIPAKKSKTEREAVVHTSMSPLMESSLVIKEEPIGITQPGALCLWQHDEQVRSQIGPSRRAKNDKPKQTKVYFAGGKDGSFSGIIVRQSVKDGSKRGEDFLAKIESVYGQKSVKDPTVQSNSYDKALVLKERDVDMPLVCTVKEEEIEKKALTWKEDAITPFICNPRSNMLIEEKARFPHADVQDSNDISRGQEVLPITIFNDAMDVELCIPFHYISKSITFQNAHVSFSLAQIKEDDCCTECFGDCLQRCPSSCQCAREMGGEFAYDAKGQLRKSLLEEAIADKKGRGLSTARTKYCETRFCVFGQGKPCKGHLLRNFIKECWSKCGCNMQCGNRIVQKGIRHNLQVFFANKKKGWGVRTLEDLPAGTFVCEYVGEILTNTELYTRNKAREGTSSHYPVLLDADWNSANIFEDDELLCLDATNYGNIARFINHRCYDANLVDIPVEIECPDRRYYHIAFFTTRLVNASEELTWDYVHFEDVKAFQCFCESPFCRSRHHKGQV